jgi:purine nucleosidase
VSTSAYDTRLVIDTDPGVDDAQAILVALAHRQHGTRVEALTTVAGNVGVDKGTANAKVILDVLAVPPEATPIYSGCPHSLVGPDVRAIFHGVDGLGNTNFPPSPRPIDPEHAALALIRLADQSPGELTLAAIGPLTNLALATRLDPSLPGKYKRLIVMGGDILGSGNMPNGAEFNTFADPEAMAVVLENWPGLWLVSWETTVKHRLPAVFVEELSSRGTPSSEFFRQIRRSMLEAMLKEHGEPSMHAADSLALAVALEPDIVTRSELRPVSVELGGRHARGHTIVDWNNYSGLVPNVNVVLELDFDRLRELLLAGVQ